MQCADPDPAFYLNADPDQTLENLVFVMKNTLTMYRILPDPVKLELFRDSYARCVSSHYLHFFVQSTMSHRSVKI
jgi:hypothetical protein